MRTELNSPYTAAEVSFFSATVRVAEPEQSIQASMYLSTAAGLQTPQTVCHLLSDAGRRPLRSHSNDIRKLIVIVPRTHNKLGDRSFSAAGPRLWNDLPPGLRRPGLSFDSFRQSLKVKTHLFGN